MVRADGGSAVRAALRVVAVDVHQQLSELCGDNYVAAWVSGNWMNQLHKIASRCGCIARQFPPQ